MSQEFISNDRYEIWGYNGWEDFDGMVINHGDFDILNITTKTSSIKCTPNHKIYITDDIYIKAGNLSIGDNIIIDGDVDEVVSMEIQPNTNVTYDIFNSDSHKVYINKILTSNCDEFAFVESHKAEEFWASNYPTVSASKGSKIIIISTPNGLYNKFHEIYSKAEKGENSFIASKYDWTAVPGRDQKWADAQIKDLGPIKFAQEFSCQFIGSSNTIIDGKTLTRLMQGITHPEFIDMGGKLRLWEKPVDGAQYVLGIDTSKGVGSDFSVIQVFRIYGIKPIRMVQVAVWEDNFTDVYHFAAIVNKMSYYFNNAHIMCENNSEGSVIVNRLWWDYENENLINTGTKNKDLGIRATTQTKPQAVLLMKKLVEDGSITIFDKNTIDQLGDFQDLGNNKYACVNCNDDCVTSMYWAIYILEQEIWDEGYEFNKTKEEDEVWGVLGDWADGNMTEDWSWMNKFTLN